MKRFALSELRYIPTYLPGDALPTVQVSDGLTILTDAEDSQRLYLRPHDYSLCAAEFGREGARLRQYVYLGSQRFLDGSVFPRATIMARFSKSRMAPVFIYFIDKVETNIVVPDSEFTHAASVDDVLVAHDPSRETKIVERLRNPAPEVRPEAQRRLEATEPTQSFSPILLVLVPVGCVLVFVAWYFLRRLSSGA